MLSGIILAYYIIDSDMLLRWKFALEKSFMIKYFTLYIMLYNVIIGLYLIS